VRSSIRSEIESIDPLDLIEEDHHADALAWVDSGAQLFRLEKPALPPKHLVSYFAVVDSGGILLVDHISAGRWLPTGGHVEPGEHPRETVARELFEELGVALMQEVGPPLMVTCTETVGFGTRHTDVSLWYVISADRSHILSYDKSEFHSVRWFDFGEIPFEQSDPHLRRFVEKLARRVGVKIFTCGV